MTEQEWRRGTDQRLVGIETRLAKLETQDAVSAVQLENVQTRLGKIESTLTWLVRLIIGAILLAFIAFIVGGGIAP
jgi:hypothetical protein